MLLYFFIYFFCDFLSFLCTVWRIKDRQDCVNVLLSIEMYYRYAFTKAGFTFSMACFLIDGI